MSRRNAGNAVRGRAAFSARGAPRDDADASRKRLMRGGLAQWSLRAGRLSCGVRRPPCGCSRLLFLPLKRPDAPAAFARESVWRLSFASCSSLIPSLAFRLAGSH